MILPIPPSPPKPLWKVKSTVEELGELPARLGKCHPLQPLFLGIAALPWFSLSEQPAPLEERKRSSLVEVCRLIIYSCPDSAIAGSQAAPEPQEKDEEEDGELCCWGFLTEELGLS